MGRHYLIWYFRFTSSASSGRQLEIMYRHGMRRCHKTPNIYQRKIRSQLGVPNIGVTTFIEVG